MEITYDEHVAQQKRQRKKKKIELKSYTVSEELFEEILTFGYRVEVIENKELFNSYKFGYPQKSLIRYDGFKQMIVLECVLNDHFNLGIDDDITYWKQCLVVKEVSQSKPVEKCITGGMAKRIMEAMILKYYSREEYEQRLNMFRDTYNESLIQYHHEIANYQEIGKIVRYQNCYKYDINGAHAYALTIIFPKAAHEIIKFYEERKINPINKQIINFYVGCLTYNYRQTYNWIVHFVSQTLQDAINYCEDIYDSVLVYANTDGFIIQNPGKLLEHSTELGKFKLEYHGDVWCYRDDNYKVYQTDTEVKGSIMYEPRKIIDLKNNKVVHYDRVKKSGYYIAENIVEEILE